MKLLAVAVVASCAAAASPANSGVAACAECHPAVARTFAQNGMGRSFSAVGKEHLAETGAYFHQKSGTYFAMLERGGQFFQRRWQLDYDGKEANVDELRVDYVLGSGNHARTYLHSNERGALIELPLGWYADGSGFAMNPGYDTVAPATRRKIDYDCMFCHNAYPSIPADHKQTGSQPVYDSVPEGIDCARCHGSGEQHVRAAKSGSPLDQIRHAIQNPARMSRERQLEVCMQCHLETTSSRLPSMIKRYDREPFSWQPSEPLSNLMLTFDHAPGSGREGKFEIVSSAYRLRQSQCFLKSSTLTCGTCHDPHNVPRGAEAINWYDAACRSCHDSQMKRLVLGGTHPSQNNCAGCHMPKRRTEDVVHAVMTDHLIQRKVTEFPPKLEERHAERDSYLGKVVPYYPATLSGIGDGLYLAAAQVLHGANLDEGIRQLDLALSKASQPNEEFYVVLGNAWLRKNRPADAVRAFREAVRMNPHGGRERKYLGIALSQAGEAVRAREELERALKDAPNDAELWYQLALLDTPAEAVKKAERAIALDEDLIDAYNSLGVSENALGNLQKATAAYLQGLRMNPFSATLHGNYGRLLAASNDRAQALFHFAAAIRLRSDFAPDRYEYALTLVQANELERAQEQVDAALQLDPKMVEALTLAGGLVARKGDYNAARKRYEEALAIRPDFGRAHLDLARVLNAQGDREGTVRHLRAAAKCSDADSARIATAALEQMGGN